MFNTFTRFMKEEEGSVIEYIIVLAVVAVLIMLMFPSLRTNLDNWYHNMLCNVEKGIGSSAGGNTSTDCNYTTNQS